MMERRKKITKKNVQNGFQQHTFFVVSSNKIVSFCLLIRSSKTSLCPSLTDTEYSLFLHKHFLIDTTITRSMAVFEFPVKSFYVYLSRLHFGSNDEGFDLHTKPISHQASRHGTQNRASTVCNKKHNVYISPTRN
jgi:hypothetical protein